jgi:hypothetical protein
MKLSETIAYNWLIRQGYKGITFHSTSTPDFTTSDNQSFEVKRPTHNTIVFSYLQIDQLFKYPNSKVLIIENNKVDPIYVINITELLSKPKKYNGLTMYYSQIHSESGDMLTRMKMGVYTYFNFEGDYLSKSETLQKLGLPHTHSIGELVLSGKIKGIFSHSKWYIDPLSVENYLTNVVNNPG